MADPTARDLTIEWRKQPNGAVSDVRITRGRSLHRLPWWKRLLMPWAHFHFYRKPFMPFPENTNDH